MIIFLYGGDSYRRLKKKKSLVSEFEAKYGKGEIGKFDLSESEDFEALKQFAGHKSLFSPKKMAVLENAFEADKKLSEFLKSELHEKELVILISEENLPKSGFPFLLKTPVLSEKFDYLSKDKLSVFIRSEAKENKVELDSNAIKVLASLFEKDPWALSTEIQKISNLKKSLKAEDIENFDAELAPDYWALMGSLRSSSRKIRLAALQKVFELGEPLGKVFYMVAALAQEDINRFAEYDKAIKSGKLDFDEALLDFALA